MNENILSNETESVPNLAAESNLQSTLVNTWDLQETQLGDFLVNGEGVFFNNNRDEKIEVCSPLLVIAVTRNAQGTDWGKLLLLLDPEGNEKQHHMKNAVLMSKPQAVITDLVDKGLILSAHPRARTLLLQYLRAVSVAAKLLSSSYPGWVGSSFLLQDTSLGSEPVLYSGNHHDHRIAILGDWNNHVGKYCAGNSRLVLSASSAFA